VHVDVDVPCGDVCGETPPVRDAQVVAGPWVETDSPPDQAPRYWPLGVAVDTLNPLSQQYENLGLLVWFQDEDFDCDTEPLRYRLVCEALSHIDVLIRINVV
jgi:hypothetical protein